MEDTRSEELANMYEAEFNQCTELFKSKLDNEKRRFIDEVEGIPYKSTEIKSTYYKAFLEGFRSGKYTKPSDFVSDKLNWLFDGYIYARFKDALCYAVDNSRSWAYSSSYHRRSFRSSKYHMDIIFDIIHRFHSLMAIDEEVSDILNLNLSEAKKAYFTRKCYWKPCGCFDLAIAYELDRKNTKVEAALEDIINGDSEVVLQGFIITGILKSNNSKMHDLLGRLLLAAKLQEGLRQIICENMDVGTVSAFKSILKVIEANDLIRFSSVKRAVGTWLGLMDPDANTLERISNKSIELILGCLEDRKYADECINTEDSMKIYVGLWSYAVYDAVEAIEIVKRLSKNGTHHQVLVSGYFVANLDNRSLAHDLAKTVISQHRDEQDIIAVYIGYFMGTETMFYRMSNKPRTDDKESFKDKEEAKQFLDIMLHIYNNISGKFVEFSPCIFPWYSATLSKATVVEKMCGMANVLKDPATTDMLCSMLKDCDANNRSRCVWLILDNPETPIQKSTVTTMLCDKESYTRRTAAQIVGNMVIEDANYLQMEDMLRYKSADMRSTLIDLLYKQSDDRLLGTIERLLGDKKEEKRTAGLDMVMRLEKDVKRNKLFIRCVESVKNISEPTSKEKVLIDNILGRDEQETQTIILYNKSDKYIPKITNEKYFEDAVSVFMEFFPDSKLKEQVYHKSDLKNVLNTIKEKLIKVQSKECEAVRKDCDSLHNLFEEHADDEFRGFGGEMYTFASNRVSFRECFEDGERDIPGMAIWKDWYETNIADHKRVFRMYVFLKARSRGMDFDDTVRPYISQIFGAGYEEIQSYKYKDQLMDIVERLMEEYCTEKQINSIACALGYWYVKCLDQDNVLIKAVPTRNMIAYCREREAHFITHSQLSYIFSKLQCKNNEHFKDMFPLAVMIGNKTFKRKVKMAEINNSVMYDTYDERRSLHMPSDYGCPDGLFSEPGTIPYILACYYGIITKQEMYEYLFRKENIDKALDVTSLVVSGLREQGRKIAKRGSRYWGYGRQSRQEMLMSDFMDDDELKEFVQEVYDALLDEVLSVELRRGDTETIYSKAVKSINRVYGTDKLVAILVALGKEKLERSTYYTSVSNKGNMSHLLSVCIPSESDNADELKEALKGTDISCKRLIEAALYSPEWIDIVGEYLNYDGFKSACYYFMAHMNESFDDKRKAIIAKFTPLSEEELNEGAFDINWFKNAYEVVGSKRFEEIYDAAKYISDGAKHSRARKYADATLGLMQVEDVESRITDKRNKDLVMAYSLIPVNNEDDIIRRYLFLQKFLKESKRFGAQRIASEKKAVDTAMSNLAMNAGYSDVLRLSLRMETKLMDDIKELFVEKQIEDVTVCLKVTEEGKTEIVCKKSDKILKSVPASLKKHDYIIRLNDNKKKLTEQYRRTKVMFEEAMEESSEFTVEEINTLHRNVVAYAIVKNLVFRCKGDIGFLRDNRLVDYCGTQIHLKDDDVVTVAHPFDIYMDGHWSDYQKMLFETQIKQPFKQVFRELYVKTDEEMELNYSRRYSGNQIQPKKTVACLKGRRWVADVEDGLQKVYYKENIVARIYAMADWFAPSDIEAPTLELVEFSDRRTGMQIKIKDIPDVIFSEVMRDVDLAVSVAHAGGVDPETSHSTVEMRSALLTFTLPLFKLNNVKINNNHAIVEGFYGTYDINLGSGVIHKRGGTMITVLPVHSQHRGKIFLPFADDDPKTAEIITKVIMFAQDKKIKDVNILEQIR